MTRSPQNLVQWVYSAQDERELAERYDEWAKTYDQDLDRDFGWAGPRIAVEIAARYLPTSARILDAGAGTGLVGELLAERGYRDLVAMDLSKGMLDQARKKGAYREFHQMVMGEPLGFQSGCFGGIISVGALTVGHAPARSLDELVRVTQEGGHVVFGLRPDIYEDGGFRDKHAELESLGKWVLCEVSDPVQVLPRGEPDVLHQVWVYRVTS